MSSEVTYIVRAGRVVTVAAGWTLGPGERWAAPLELQAARERGATADLEPVLAGVYRLAAEIRAINAGAINALHSFAAGRERVPGRVRPLGAGWAQTVETLHEIDRLAESRSPAYALWRLVWLHPYSDGNGRTSRALCYALALQADPRLREAHRARAGGTGRDRLTLPERLERHRSVYVAHMNGLHEAEARGLVEQRALRLEALEAYLQGLVDDQVAVRPSRDDLP
jgi:hypothetical protein